MPDDGGVTLDVTTVIGAQEYLTSRNNSRPTEDPFARECFVELIQTLIFNSQVLVAHPVLVDPRAVDFGEHPHLLRALLARGLVRPLRLPAGAASLLTNKQRSIARQLEQDGVQLLFDYIEQVRRCDAVPNVTSIADRIKTWSSFQNKRVRTIARHHPARIPTRDGIEEDEIGAWARASAASIKGRLSRICPRGDEAHIVAFLTRGLKYQAMADVAGSRYQPHIARRDFTVSFQLGTSSADWQGTNMVIELIRGMHDAMLVSADVGMRSRVQLLAYELPLLGGRLWSEGETGRFEDRSWIEVAVDRIADYKSRCAELRSVAARCLFEEDRARVVLDLDEVTAQLLDRLGLRQARPTAVERDLLKAASVAESALGVPKVSPLLIRPLVAAAQHGFRGNSYQQFLYKEFMAAWRRS